MFLIAEHPPESDKGSQYSRKSIFNSVMGIKIMESSSRSHNEIFHVGITNQGVRNEQQFSVGSSNNDGEVEGPPELQPPSYVEALEREVAAEAAEEAGGAGRDFRHYVVQIEVSSSVASEDDGESEGRAGSDQSQHEDLADGRST